jgi:VanZ family protein
MLKLKIFRSKWLAISWFIFISVLFFLPGSALPPGDSALMIFLDKIHFDKWVHVGFFAILLFLWRTAFDETTNNLTPLLFFSALLYGFLVELIQHQWVANRSFDMYDIVADTIGNLSGLIVWLRVYKKNKPL